MQNTSTWLPWSPSSKSRGHDKPHSTFSSTWSRVPPQTIHGFVCLQKADVGSVLDLNELGNSLRFSYRTVNAERGSEGVPTQKWDQEELRYLPGWVLQDCLLATTLSCTFSHFLGPVDLLISLGLFLSLSQRHLLLSK